MHFAHITGARSAKEVWAYLPHNYVIVGGGAVQDGKAEYIIGGLDQAGWTLDDYVIPRLHSGCISAREITAGQAVDWIAQYRVADCQGGGWYLLDEIVAEQPPIAVHKG